MLYFTEAYIDYSFNAQIWITSVPIIITFCIIYVVIDNLLQIYNQLAAKEDKTCLHNQKYYRPIAVACIFTQVLNPILALFEKYD